MVTKHLLIEQCRMNESIQIAAKLLRKGEVVAIPTETVYGLGADATNERAVEKIFQAKGRPSDNPLIVHIATKKALFELVMDSPDYLEDLIDHFSPGPITYVLKSNGKIASNVTAGLSTLGVRIPSNEIALELLRQVKLPIAAPSANLSGKPSPTTAQHVLEDMHGKIAAVLDGGSSEVGVESTVVDCTGEIPTILRLGKITAEDINQVVGAVQIVDTNNKKIKKPKSPGMKYKHYAPDVPLILVKDSSKLKMMIEQRENKGERVGVLVSLTLPETIRAKKVKSLGGKEDEMAINLYNLLRSFKPKEVDIIICEAPLPKGIGTAILDRLERAATKIID